MRQRLETARARRVEFQIERVDVFMGEQIRRHRVVAALERVGGVVIAAAYVGVNHEVFGRAFDSGVVQRYAELAHLLDIDGLHARFRHEIGVAVNAPRAVVELNVAATRGIQIGDHLAICGSNRIGKFFIGRIHAAQAFLLAIATIERHFRKRLDGRRNGLARNVAVTSERLHELEMLNERVLLPRNRTRYHRGIGRGFLIVEHIALAARAALNTLKAPHEVEMPIAATEFAIGHNLQARSLLLGDKVANGHVFHGLELGGVDDARIEVGTRLLQHVGTKKAANDIAAKRCISYRIRSHV